MHWQHKAVCVALAMDSLYAHTGLQRNALKWQASGWFMAQEPVITVDLWMEVIKALLDVTGNFWRVSMPSRIQWLALREIMQNNAG